jgi:hypothetical protein
MRSNLAMVPGLPEDRVADAVRALTAAVATLQQLSARDGALPVAGGDVLDLTAALHTAADTVRALAVSATAVVDELDAARTVGCTSTSRWLQQQVGMSVGGAGATVATGRAMAGQFRSTGAAWIAGEVSEAAVREITAGVSTAVRGLAPEGAAVERRRLEAVLLDVARRRPPAHVREAVGRLRVAADPDGAAAAQEAAHDAQYLRFTPVADGLEVRGFLTTQVGAGVITGLDRIVDGYHRSGELSGGEREALGSGQPARRRDTRAHLHARALHDLVDTALGAGMLGRCRGQRPHVTYTIHDDELAAGLGGEVLVPGHGSVALPTAIIERVLCDADVHPVLTRRGATASVAGRPAVPVALLDSFGAPVDPYAGEADALLDDDVIESWARRLSGERGRHVLDLGRTFRTAPPDLRRALEVRDQHCVFPGCRVDPSRCEAHHVVHWRRGGSTSLDNLALLCLGHHHTVHEGGWVVAVRPGSPPGDPDRWIFTPPLRQPHPDD